MNEGNRRDPDAPGGARDRRPARTLVDAPALTLYQAEWCPFSSAVREVLTELGTDVILRQVEPWPEERATLRRLAGTDHIPVLQDEDGTFHRGTREIFAHLRKRHPWRFSASHRRRFAEHRNAHEANVTKQLIEHFRGAHELEGAGSDRATQASQATS